MFWHGVEPRLKRADQPADLGRLSVFLSLICLASIAMAAESVRAEDATVAVAANFLIPMRALESEFENSTGYQITVTSGSTGQLYAQIVNGAPYDVLLAADQERPERLAGSELGDAYSVFTYAIGQLVLWSANTAVAGEGGLERILERDFRWFAIPEPDVAPYGAAARQTLENLGIWSALQSRLVKGQNVAQTFAMLETGNAQLGLVALSQASAYEGSASYQIVPSRLHDPIRQDAILLRRATENRAARQFLEFLRTPAATEIIERHGYAVSRQPD